MRTRILLLPLFILSSALAFSQVFIKADIVDLDIIEREFKQKEYFEMPYNYFSRGKVPTDGYYVLFAYNSQEYGPIYEVNDKGQVGVKFNLFTREIFKMKPVASYPGPAFIVFNELPNMLLDETEIFGVIIARFLKTVEGIPCFQFIEGAFLRNLSEHLQVDPVEVNLDSFSNISELSYVDSMY